MPFPLIAAGVMAGGKLLGGANQAGAARRRNNILAGGAREQSRAGMEGASVMGDFISQLRGSAPNPGVEREAFQGSLGTPQITGVPGASRQFNADAATTTGGAQGYGQNMADLFARIRAPARQRQDESRTMLRMNDALRPIQMRAEDQAFLTQLRAQMEQPNPWTGLLAQGASNVGSYYAGKK